MKRILFFSHAMELGGAERALLGLLGALDQKNCRVDLFLMRRQGELLRHLPEWVHLLPELPQYASLAVPMGTVLKKGQLAVAWGRLEGKCRAKRYEAMHPQSGDSAVELEYSHKYTCRFMPAIRPDTEYDLAISFLTPHYFVARKVRAKRKIAWIHTDYSRVGVDEASELAMWDAYDRIVSISDAVTDSFLQVFPELREKIVLMENILPEALVREGARADVSREMPDDGRLRLLSVGRYSYAKNFDNVPDLCRRLLADGLDVKWYLIGYGGEESLIRRKIAESGMEERVVLLGKRENPYPYFAACDLYVQPSRYEGKCVSVREAQMLGKPVAITNYATSGSQLEDGVDGIIVPMDNAGCAAGLAALLRDPERMKMLAENCRRRDYTNARETEKLYRLMGE